MVGLSRFERTVPDTFLMGLKDGASKFINFGIKMSRDFEQYFERKMKTLFVRLDLDKNNRIDKNDLDGWLSKIGEFLEH